MSWLGDLVGAASSALGSGGFLGAGLSALGSLFGRREDRKAQEDANAQNVAYQREFAQHGVSWRVEDAKRAGLHPLFALGGSGAAFSPSVQPVMTGQNLSRAAQAVGDFIGQREIMAAQLDAMKAAAAKDYAMAAAADSETARMRQSQVVPVAQSFGVGDPRHAMSSDLELDGQPNARLSAGSPLPPVETLPGYLTSDVKPGFSRFVVPGLGEILLPSASSMSEALESLENTNLQAAVLAANVAHYGDAGARRVKRLMGSWWSDPMGSGVRAARGYARSRGVQIRE